MDDPDCDSTWEDDEEDAGDEEDEDAGRDDAEDEDAGELRAARPGAHQSRTPRPRNWRAMQDMCRYRRHYPGLVERDGNGDMPNLSFYKNKICFLPNGCLIEEFLQQWRSRYSLLEDNHSYIQWLFPLREAGVNWHAKPLTLREVEAFKSSKEVRERLVRAYELMLDFYGIQLQDRDTGAVCRAHNYQKRFQNLNWHRPQQPAHHAHAQVAGRAGPGAVPGAAGALLPGGDAGAPRAAGRAPERAGLLRVRRSLPASAPRAPALRLGALPAALPVRLGPALQAAQVQASRAAGGPPAGRGRPEPRAGPDLRAGPDRGGGRGGRESPGRQHPGGGA